MSQNLTFSQQGPVPVSEIRIEEIGVNPLDPRRVDVAVDLSPCQQSVTVRMAIVGPDDEEWASTALIQHREWALDRVMHLCRDAVPGDYILHVGIFDEETLVRRTAKQFKYPAPGPGQG